MNLSISFGWGYRFIGISLFGPNEVWAKRLQAIGSEANHKKKIFKNSILLMLF